MASFNKTGTISITCPKQMEGFLAEEIEEAGYTISAKRFAGVEMEGSLTDCMRLNLMLHTAHRIHYLVGEGKANSPENLEKLVSSLPWEEYISETGYLSVTSSVDQAGIRNSQFANVKVKDAIVDRIRSKKGIRPNSGSRLSGTVVFLFWKSGKARLFLDTSGTSLSRRGYRSENHLAPMQETLAVALLRCAGWNPSIPLVNPMCGSGTIAIEAALIAAEQYPGMLRPHFGFKHILGFNEEKWQKLRSSLKKKSKTNTAPIIATDIDRNAVTAAQKNAHTAGVEKLIDFETCDFTQTRLPEQKGIIILNPPYGERIGNTRDLEKFYTSIGDFLKQHCTGWRAFILSGNPELIKKIGLRASSKNTFFNSTIECKFLEYKLY